MFTKACFCALLWLCGSPLAIAQDGPAPAPLTVTGEGAAMTAPQTEDYLRQKFQALTIRAADLVPVNSMTGPVKIKRLGVGLAYFYIDDETPLSFEGEGAARSIHIRISTIGEDRLERSKAHWVAEIAKLEPEPRIEGDPNLRLILTCSNSGRCATAQRSGQLDFSSANTLLSINIGRDRQEAMRIARAFKHLITLWRASHAVARDPFDGQ